MLEDLPESKEEMEDSRNPLVVFACRVYTQGTNAQNINSALQISHAHKRRSESMMFQVEQNVNYVKEVWRILRAQMLN